MPHDWKSDWRPDDDEEEFCGNDDVEDCPHCGEAIYDDSAQCHHCGTYLDFWPEMMTLETGIKKYGKFWSTVAREGQADD